MYMFVCRQRYRRSRCGCTCTAVWLSAWCGDPTSVPSTHFGIFSAKTLYVILSFLNLFFLSCNFFNLDFHISGFLVLFCLQNGSFSVPWLGVTGLASIGSTPLALLDQAKSCCSPAPLDSSNHTHLYRSTNSFLIFLRILAIHLKQESGAPWRQIKGRSVCLSQFLSLCMCVRGMSLSVWLCVCLLVCLCVCLEWNKSA